jgi:hypothetical protein
MEFSGFGGHKGYARLALGAAPILVGWPTLALQPTMALIAQWVGFTALWYADLKATHAGWGERAPSCADFIITQSPLPQRLNGTPNIVSTFPS